MPPTEALIAGHLCLDIIPTFKTKATGSLSEILVPGKLVDVADAVLSTGGATSNTGLALNRLGLPVSIAGKIGDDHFGKIIVSILRSHGEHLTRDMITGKGEASSYSVVLNPPGVDRVFLHNAGANDTFTADEVPDEALRNTRLLHFGYPPLMRNFYRNDGHEMKRLFSRAREAGVTTSLDMARPDPDGESGQVDWGKYLREVLPTVDIFLPSIDEILFMLDRPLFDSLARQTRDGNIAAFLDCRQVREIADRLLALGPAIVGFKLGDEGFYLKTTRDAARMSAAGRGAPARPEEWTDREIASGCKEVTVCGTTGAGDCTIAGFLAGVLRGLTPEEAVEMAVAVGGASVEAPDSVSGVPDWRTLCDRLAAGWRTHTSRLQRGM